MYYNFLFPLQETGRRSSWFRSLPLFGRSSTSSGQSGHHGPPGLPSLPSSAMLPGQASATASVTAQAKKSSSCLVEVVLQWTPHEVNGTKKVYFNYHLWLQAYLSKEEKCLNILGDYLLVLNKKEG